MKIIGGSFGAKGKARIVENYLEVLGAKRADYKRSDVSSVSLRQEKEKHFGFVGAIIGAVLFGFLGALVFGPIGMIAGLAFAIAGSFYKTSRYLADLEFKDGLKLTLEPSKREATKLLNFSET